MKTITVREFYDRIMAAVEDGTLPSVDMVNLHCGLPTCKYRQVDETGKVHKCVAGLLIDDDCYDPQMEHWTASCVWDGDRATYNVTNVEGKDRWWIRKLQKIHDKQFGMQEDGSFCAWNKEKFIADINAIEDFREFAKS